MKKHIRKLLYFIAFALMIGAFIYLGAKDYSTEEDRVSDSEAFAEQYNLVPKDNVFTIKKIADIKTILENGNAIVFIGDSSSIWAQHYAKLLYELSLENDLDEIVYYDITKDKMQRSKSYTDLLDMLVEGVYTVDRYEKELFTPCLYFIKNGEVIAFDNTTAMISANTTPEKYWDSYNTYTFKERIAEYIQYYREK